MPQKWCGPARNVRLRVEASMKRQTVLLLDTAMPSGVVALARDEEILSEEALGESRQHGEKLSGAIENVLAGAQVRMSELDGIAVGVGPGSFVGVRVAMATAKGLALALDVPLFGVSTLAAVAGGCAVEQGQRLLVAIDARRGEAYAQAFEGAERNWAPQSKVQACPPDELRVLLEGQDRVVGNASFLLPELALPNQEVSGPSGLGLMAALRARTAAGPLSNELVSLVPAYVRAPDAKKPAVAPDYSVNPSAHK